MEKGQVACPSCGYEFEISDALSSELREHLKEELQAGIVKREAEVSSRLEAVNTQQEELRKSRENLEDQVEKRLEARLIEVEQKAIKKAENKYSVELEDLNSTVKERDEAIAELRNQELDLRKKQRQLEEEKEALDVQNARKLDQERGIIRANAVKKAAEDHHLKDLEKDKMITDLKSSLEEMRQRAEQGSMEIQGEVLEQDLEAHLRDFFQHDDIKPVPKGIRGADLVQTVCTPLGVECGIILWEAKNTKAWNANWISKLKDDMIETRATIAILVSAVLPDDIGRFGQRDGVWISDLQSAVPLASALREQLLVVNRERAASVGKSEKMESLYLYMAGTEFKQKIEGIVDAFTSMQEQLNKERRSMEKHWNLREKEIQRVIKNTVGLYGDMQGIIGGQIPPIPALELGDPEPKQLKPIENTDSSKGSSDDTDQENLW